MGKEENSSLQLDPAAHAAATGSAAGCVTEIMEPEVGLNPGTSKPGWFSD